MGGLFFTQVSKMGNMCKVSTSPVPQRGSSYVFFSKQTSFYVPVNQACHQCVSRLKSLSLEGTLVSYYPGDNQSMAII